jgi:tetratricopeptide (TPR) repeat protein
MNQSLLTIALCFLLTNGVRADEDSVAKARAAGLAALEQGQPIEAERHLTLALRTAESHDGDKVLIANLRIELARAQSDCGSYGEAEKTARRAQELLAVEGKRRDAESGMCLTVRAENFRRVGLYHEAARLGRDGLTLRERALGTHHPGLVETLETLGRIFHDSPQDSSVETSPGESHSQTFDVIGDAWDYREEARRKMLPSAIPVLLLRATEDSLRGGEEALARPAELVRTALTSATKHLGKDHPLRAECLIVLAEVLTKQKRFREAEDAQKEALAILANLQGAYPHLVERGLVNSARLLYLRGRRGEAEKQFADALLYRFRGVKDDDLCTFFKMSASHRVSMLGFGRENPNFERFLVEMVRRKTTTMEESLKLCSMPLDPDLLERHPRVQQLEVLTALRRVQGKPDPVTIEVKKPEQIVYDFPDAPDLVVSLQNRDTDNTCVAHIHGRDSRGGHASRWYFQVHDSKGNLVPGFFPWDSYRVRMYSVGSLKAGESIEVELEARNFVRVPEPGDYSLQILFHESVWLADLGGEPEEAMIADRVTCHSKMLKMTVRPREIIVGQHDRAESLKLLDALPTTGPIPVVVNEYGEWAHKQIPPDSPAGKLLALGWKAVPILLNELDRKELGEKRRAWILSLLFSITKRNDPRPDEMADYTPILGRITTVDQFVTRESFSLHEETKIDVDKQKEFARCWSNWKKCIVVREPAKP